MSKGREIRLSDAGAAPFSAARQRSRMAYGSIDDAFPKVDPGHEPFNDRVLVQLRSVVEKTAGGLQLVHDTQQTEKDNAQVAKVIAIGPLAFRNRETMELWPEGAWFGVGEFVRVPKYGGDRFEVEIPKEDQTTSEKAVFALFKDLDFLARITCDPMTVVAYI